MLVLRAPGGWRLWTLQAHRQTWEARRARLLREEEVRVFAEGVFEACVRSPPPAKDSQRAGFLTPSLPPPAKGHRRYLLGETFLFSWL